MLFIKAHKNTRKNYIHLTCVRMIVEHIKHKEKKCTTSVQKNACKLTFIALVHIPHAELFTIYHHFKVYSMYHVRSNTALWATLQYCLSSTHYGCLKGADTSAFSFTVYNCSQWQLENITTLEKKANRCPQLMLSQRKAEVVTN